MALRWTPTFDGNQPITSFLVNLQNINLTSSVPLGTLQVSNLMFRDGNFMYNVTAGILPFTNYNFNVRACNLLGCGNPSQFSPTVMSLPDGKQAFRGVEGLLVYICSAAEEVGHCMLPYIRVQILELA